MKCMKIFNIAEHKVLLCCAGILAFGTCSGHAVYPSEGILWRHLRGNNNEGRTIPDAYKALSKKQKQFEAEEKKGISCEDKKRKELKCFWEEEKKGEKFKRKLNNCRVAFSVWGLGSDGSTWRRIFDLKRFFAGCLSEEQKRVLEKWNFVADGKEAIFRCLRVVASESFLIRVLGKDFVDALIKEYNTEVSVPEISFTYSFENPFCGLPPITNRIMINMKVKQEHTEILDETSGTYIKIHPNDAQKMADAGKSIHEKTFTDFCVLLRLMWNIRKDEIEKVEVCDEFVVNRPISYFKKAFTIFEKK